MKHFILGFLFAILISFTTILPLTLKKTGDMNSDGVLDIKDLSILAFIINEN